jgi:formylglycine-generating enzyme required for sulfatase activity
MSYIFISYSHKDKAYVHRLQQGLQHEGFEVWIDDRIDYGTEWPKVIQKRLDECDAFIVVVSENAYASKWVQNEVARAARKKKTVFPLLLQGDPWLSVEATQYFDVTNGSLPDEKFYQRLSSVVLRQKAGKRDVIARLAPKANTRILGVSSVILFALIFGGLGLNYVFDNLLVKPVPTTSPTKATTSKPPTSTNVPFTSISEPTKTLVPSPTLGIGSAMVSGIDGMTLLYVPEGKFTMGTKTEDAVIECQKYRSDCQLYSFKDQEPPHEVDLNAYWIGQTEVTNEMYAKCVDAGKCNPPNSTERFSNSSYADHPVFTISWFDAAAYCSWVGRRLPTEAEWEKAASWDESKQNKSMYPWGNSIDCSFANYRDSILDNGCIGDTTPVRSYPSGISPYGAYNMAGNVLEWVADWYEATYYQSSDLSNPLGPDSGASRVIRGGGLADTEIGLFTTFRFPFPPWVSNIYVGFRCASDATQ